MIIIIISWRPNLVHQLLLLNTSAFANIIAGGKTFMITILHFSVEQLAGISKSCCPSLCLKGHPPLPLSLSLNSRAEQTLHWVTEGASLPLRSALWKPLGKKTCMQAAAICGWETALAEMKHWTSVCGRTLAFLVAYSSWKAWLMHSSAGVSHAF